MLLDPTIKSSNQTLEVFKDETEATMFMLSLRKYQLK